MPSRKSVYRVSYLTDIYVHGRNLFSASFGGWMVTQIEELLHFFLQLQLSALFASDNSKMSEIPRRNLGKNRFY